MYTVRTLPFRWFSSIIYRVNVGLVIRSTQTFSGIIAMPLYRQQIVLQRLMIMLLFMTFRYEMTGGRT